LILLAVPLLGLVRLDLWAGHHVLLGSSVDLITGIKGIVVAIGALWGVTFTTNVLVGRFFCGWGCPVGYVSRLGEDLDVVKKQRKSRARWLFDHAKGAGFVATFVGAILLWWVDPAVLVEGTWTARLIVIGAFLTLCLGGFLHAFWWRFGFCVNVCPIGLYYRFVTSRAPIGIQFTNRPDPCIECGACETICPVAIDPKALGQEIEAPSDDGGPSVKRYGDAECIRCGDCVEACRMVFRPRQGQVPPLRFGRIAELLDAEPRPAAPPTAESARESS
jgi:polyferredoxin